MSFWQIVRQEINYIFIKDPRRAIFLLGASLMYVIIFCWLYSASVVNSIPLIVYDQDQTGLSRSLSQAFEDSERYQVVAYVSSQEDMEEYLRNKTAYAALAIPANFSRDVKTGAAPRILVEVNSANLVIGNSVMSSAQEIMAEYSAGIGRGLVESIGQMPDESLNKVAPVEFRLRVLNNPTLGYLNFFVLGVSMAALQQGILLSTGAGLFAEYQGLNGFCRLQPAAVIGGRLLPYWLGGISAYSMALFISSEVFHIASKGSVMSLLLLGAAFAFAIVTLAGLLASFCKSEVSYTQLCLSYAVPSFIYSGYTWPLQAMDRFSQFLCYLFPLNYIANDLRDLMVAGYAPLFWRDVTLLLLIGMVAFSLLVWRYDRKRRQDAAGTAALQGEASV